MIPIRCAHFGEEVVTRLCQRLLEGGAPGIHFYTLNRWKASTALCRNLGLGNVEEADRQIA